MKVVHVSFLFRCFWNDVPLSCYVLICIKLAAGLYISISTG
jgi:uncharacterized membrane protein